MTRGRAEAPVLLSAQDPSAAAMAADALRGGKVVAIPTDTVYGLAAALDRSEAIARIYGLKGRSHEKAIPVLLADVAALERVAASVPPPAQALVDRFWPGALTVVFSALPGLPEAVTSVAADGTRTVAVRVPNHPVAREILSAAGGALAVTSANRSGDSPALDAQSVMALGDAAPDLVVDGGPAPLREPSTIVLALTEEISVLRTGAIPAAAIAEAARRGIQDSGPHAPHAV